MRTDGKSKTNIWYAEIFRLVDKHEGVNTYNIKIYNTCFSCIALQRFPRINETEIGNPPGADSIK